MVRFKNIGFLFLLLAWCTLAGCRKTTLDDVHGNIAPTIRFVSPQNNAVLEKDSIVNFILEPKDEDGSISKVEIYKDGSLMRVLHAEPWEFDIQTSTIGSGQHSLLAIAQDNLGALGSAMLEISMADERDSIVGDFAGIEIYWHWVSSTNQLAKDTISVTATLQKSVFDSLVDLSIHPNIWQRPLTFQYQNGVFVPTITNYNSILTLTGDSLYCYYKPALAPYWYEYIVTKL